MSLRIAGIWHSIWLIFWHSIWHSIWRYIYISIWHIFWHLSGILHLNVWNYVHEMHGNMTKQTTEDQATKIYSRIYSEIMSVILSDIYSDILHLTFYQTFNWHFIEHPIRVCPRRAGELDAGTEADVSVIVWSRGVCFLKIWRASAGRWGKTCTRREEKYKFCGKKWPQ